MFTSGSLLSFDQTSVLFSPTLSFVGVTEWPQPEDPASFLFNHKYSYPVCFRYCYPMVVEEHKDKALKNSGK